MIPVLFMALAAQTPWGRIDPPPGLECVSKGSDALVLQGEELLAMPHVKKILLSPSGRFALLLSTPAAEAGLWEGTTQVSILNIAKRSVTSVAEFPPNISGGVEFGWAPQDQLAALTWTRTIDTGWVYSLLQLDASSGRVARLGQGTSETWGEFARLTVSPQGRVVIVGQTLTMTDSGGQGEASFLFRSLDGGRLSDPAKFVRETSGPKTLEWSADGRLLSMRVDRGDAVRGGVRAESAVYNPDAKTLLYEPIVSEPPPEAEPDFSLVRRLPTVEANRWPHAVDTLWLEASMPSDEPSAFVCAEPDAWAVAPNLDYLLYTSKGALWIRTLKKMRVAEVRELQIKAIQDLAIGQGQRMGRAVVLYWRDNGQLYPPQKSFAEAIRTYNEDDAGISRFVPTYAGGPVRPGVDTETTPAGYIDAKIGRAYVMLDGRVHWEFNPKSN